MESADTGLSSGQIAAITVSVASVVVVIIAVTITVHYLVVRRRQYDVEEIPKREFRVSPTSTISQLKPVHTNDTRLSAADTCRSSIWGDTGQCVVPTPSLNSDVWDSRRWPLPPGHSERYTFFSERSSTSVDDLLEAEQQNIGDQDNEYRPAVDSELKGARGGPDVERRCDSIWGISEIGMAR